MKLFSYRNLRVLFLFILLLVVAILAQEQRLASTDWIEPLDVTIYPINGDGDVKTVAYINQLKVSHFVRIDDFLAQQGKRYQLMVERPTQTRLGVQINELPPSQPARSANPIELLIWSLKLRYWAWQVTPESDAALDAVQLFVVYHQGREGQPLDHSLGLQKGLLGLINAYARPEQDRQNAIVIAHELLHTVGASDKYDQHGNPVYPEGFAKPDKQPRYPQHRAEIMAGRLAVDAGESKMPSSLRVCVIGEQTAREIMWLVDGE
ncbi:MAG: hypothetical protein L3J28_13470 [Candidatus Polarisedimenticolaceae bacterium]|nr:hypothetical protein [Candidatus Polarisedimenticolaceae bacterium]